jgi:DNA polymerase (family X)
MALREARRVGLPARTIIPVGSLRRFAPDIGDVTLLASVDAPRIDQVLAGFISLPMATVTIARDAGSATIATERGPITMHVTTPEHSGPALLWHTGSRVHTEQLAQRAVRLGYRFSHEGLWRDGARVSAHMEQVAYAHLDLPYIPPELREGVDEIEVAEQGRLPLLVSEIHIRGDLHMHSTWSDGRDGIEAMVRAAQLLEYEYVAITDHSQHSFASRTLQRADVERQRNEIQALRAKLPAIEILHGVEVDIMKDGSLDFDDELLEGLDIVLASLHDHGGQSVGELMSRYLKAMAHPLVNVITHPANRTPALSPGYPLDFDTLFAAAVETGTAMEVDGAPGHLDMDGALARRAAAAGVTIVIDSDCHRTDALARQMRFGIGTARRGWLEPRHVLNTRGIDDVRAFIATKRARV